MQRIIALHIFVLLQFSTGNTASIPLPDYYGGTVQWQDSAELKQKLFTILDSYHLPQSNGPDRILSTCKETSCYKHISLGYKKAREYLFGYLYLQGKSPSTYSIVTSYCQKVITNKDLSQKDPLAPLSIPDSKVINAEHTWPQSYFAKNFPSHLQKSDLQILKPEYSNVNSQRSNHPFGEVKTVNNSLCPNSALGVSAENKVVFEPHDDFKGNVARALFYFSVRYKLKIDSTQEQYLRKWHQLDPVDQQEQAVHEEIFQLQNNRNPFIDAPELVQEINDF